MLVASDITWYYHLIYTIGQCLEMKETYSIEVLSLLYIHTAPLAPIECSSWLSLKSDARPVVAIALVLGCIISADQKTLFGPGNLKLTRSARKL
jgi:hypothetical protein